jgi:hypothetical protein
MKKVERPEERVLLAKGEDFRYSFTEHGVGMRRRDCLGILGEAAFARPQELTTSAKQTTLWSIWATPMATKSIACKNDHGART